MSKDWILTVTCSDCGAVTTYRNEKPDWQTDDALVAEFEAAKAFVEAHKGRRPAEVHEQRPKLVSINLVAGRFQVDEPQTKFTICPACGGKAYTGSGGEPVGTEEKA